VACCSIFGLCHAAQNFLASAAPFAGPLAFLKLVDERRLCCQLARQLRKSL